MLGRPPGANPLSGARLFVDGPRHGSAAGAIARLLGIDASTPVGSALPAFSDRESWATFQRRIAGRLARLPASTRFAVRMLEKIAGQPEAQRVSSYAEGGGPGAIYRQAVKLFCHNLTADRGSIPVIVTDFLHASLGGCPTAGQIAAGGPAFRRRVDELARATGRRPAVYLLELDGLGSSRCMARRGDLGQWEAEIRYEVDTMARLPHAVVYVEAGYADANSAAYTAKALSRVDIGRIRGFFTNDTHIDWTLSEVKWAERVARMTHGAHFIVNTAQNGNGPKVNPRPGVQGNEDLCNPPGRGLGPRPTTDTGFPHADAFLWTHVPGNSSGNCNGGPPAGTFWIGRAIQLAAEANAKLGPRWPSRPY
jgi:endoglucanase